MVKMKNIYFVICGKCRKFKNPKIPYILEKTLIPYIVCSNCDSNDGKYLKEKNHLRY